MNDDWQAAQHADELAMQEAAMRALKKAHELGLSETECMAIAYPAGMANDFYKELHNP